MKSTLSTATSLFVYPDNLVTNCCLDIDRPSVIRVSSLLLGIASRLVDPISHPAFRSLIIDRQQRMGRFKLKHVVPLPAPIGLLGHQRKGEITSPYYTGSLKF